MQTAHGNDSMPWRILLYSEKEAKSTSEQTKSPHFEHKIIHMTSVGRVECAGFFLAFIGVDGGDGALVLCVCALKN